MNTSFITAMALILILIYQQSEAAGDDDCEFDFFSHDTKSNLGQRLTNAGWSSVDIIFFWESYSQAEIRIYTKDGDVEETTEDIWWNHHNVNNEDIDGDYNIEKIEIDIYMADNWKKNGVDDKGAMELLNLWYLTIRCGYDINPWGRLIIYSDMLTYKHMRIWPAAWNCGEDDRECKSKHIEVWD